MLRRLVATHLDIGLKYIVNDNSCKDVLLRTRLIMLTGYATPDIDRVQCCAVSLDEQSQGIHIVNLCKLHSQARKLDVVGGSHLQSLVSTADAESVADCKRSCS